MDREYLVGIDLTPKAIEAGLVDLNGKVIKKIVIPSESSKGKKKLIENICIAVKKVEKNRVLGVGIAIPGTVNKEKGIVIDCEIPGMQNMPLKKLLNEKLNVPIYIESIGNCFTLAEYKCANDRKTTNMVGIVINDRVHSGLISDSKLIRGFTNSAGALAHTVIHPDGLKCDCGNKGCLQAYVAIPEIEKRYKQKTRKAKTFEEIAKDKAKPAKDILHETGTYLGLGLANIVNTLNPEVIVVRGAVIENDEVISLAEKEMTKRLTDMNNKVRIVKSKLDDAGILGAASIVL